jgi:putative ABC transport system permease protein
MNERIPKWPFRFLRWFCPPGLLEEIEGDLLQRYERDLDHKLPGRVANRHSRRVADARLLWNTLRFLRPGIILRNKFSFDQNPIDMWMQQLKFSARVLMKDKFFSTLNVLGLALGISVSIILLLILQNDLTYDQHYTQYKRIYRLGSHYQITGTDEYVGVTARELGPILKEELPEIESFARLSRWSTTLVKAPGIKDKAFYETKIAQTDSCRSPPCGDHDKHSKKIFW